MHRYANPTLGTTSRAPLYQRSSKVNGETTIRILTEDHAERYKE
ncbi:hypothetical protein ART_0127 [Arthrobacter sp. PAMC 25486]|nr:hypothetical protein [Arthrobacter sp. PAMC 25486]AIX99725.1 hypothetical protein ART_0127 [Arthrobacter sp. PAMC 25486]